MNVSIALCTYNGERYLEQQLDSYIRQSTQPNELVVVDDASSDSTFTILREFAERAPFRVELHRNQSNLGVTANFEKALSLCRGDIIFPSDQDDVWHADKITKFLPAFSRPETHVVACDVELVDGDLRPLHRTLWDAVKFGPQDVDQVRSGGAFEALVQRNFAAGMAMALRSSFLVKALPIPPSWIHDGWIAMAAAVEGGIDVVPQRLVSYRLHGKNVVGVKSLTLVEHIKHAIALDNRLLLEQSVQMEAVLARFGERLSAERADFLSAKSRHYRVRGTMPTARLKRLPVVIQELISRRYHRFSFSYLAALRDLVR